MRESRSLRSFEVGERSKPVRRSSNRSTRNLPRLMLTVVARVQP